MKIDDELSCLGLNHETSQLGAVTAVTIVLYIFQLQK
jgi:hypothetical protein